ncbi:MAG: substrate-binding domain-containing protein [Natronomonas sp.]
MHRRDFLAATAVGFTAGLAGCSNNGGETGAAIVDETLTLATTTSTYDTGLLDELDAAFEERYGVRVDPVAQGTGAALQTGRNGDADVVLVHARTLEDEFLRDGHGINRRDLMRNDFVVVGPDEDPAEIDDLSSVKEAFRAIADAEATFISRGDGSGTHAKELEIWEAASVNPSGEWYRQAGAGMGEVLTQTNQTPAYTLSDRGTYLALRSQLDVSIRLQGPLEGGPELLANPYGIVAVNPARHENVQYDLAMAYIGFVTSHEGQRIIENYTVDGEKLFLPGAVSEDPDFEQYVPQNWTTEED